MDERLQSATYLAALREQHKPEGRYPRLCPECHYRWSPCDVEELLDHIDAQDAELARLRER